MAKDNKLDEIKSQNIGVAHIDGKVVVCYFEVAKDSKVIEFACQLSNGTEIDPKKVSPINDMFYKQYTPDHNGPHSNKIACIEKNTECEFFGKIKSSKSIDKLVKLSIYEKDIYWYNEDHGVQIVNVNTDKTLPLKTILKIEKAVNKWEKKAIKDLEIEEPEIE